MIVLSVTLIAWTAQAQQPSDIHQSTTTPANARFEIVQSELAAKWTFRLDRFTGHVAQLVRTPSDENTWEEMTIVALPEIGSLSRPRFQIFTSGIAARHTFLIDTDTGQTWVIVTSKRKGADGKEYEVSIWQRFAIYEPRPFGPDARTTNVVLVNAAPLHEAERLIESCEHCNPEGAEIPFDNILDRVTGSDPSVTDYVLEQPAKCPNCRLEILEKTLVEPAE